MEIPWSCVPSVAPTKTPSRRASLPRGLQVAFSKVVQNHTDSLGRELLAKEITDLFEETYFLTETPRFSIVDYSITTDRSKSPAPVAPGKTPVTKDLMRVFNGVISFDGKKLKLQSRSNGPISGLANATRMWYRAH